MTFFNFVMSVEGWCLIALLIHSEDGDLILVRGIKPRRSLACSISI